MEIAITLLIFSAAAYFVLKSLRKTSAGDCGSCGSCGSKCSSYRDEDNLKFMDR